MFNKQKSFTLLEVLIAVAITTIGLVGALSLISFSIKTGSSNINKVIAVNLAQEGIEIVRNIRDNNLKDGLSWIKNIGDGYVDYSDNSIHASNIDSDNNKLFLKNNKYMHDDSGTPTAFKRFIDVSSVSNRMEVIVKVYINNKLAITLVDHLYNLQ